MIGYKMHCTPVLKGLTKYLCIVDGDNTKYMKILIASASEITALIIEPEKKCLQQQLDEAESSEICFIEGALTMLKVCRFTTIFVWYIYLIKLSL